VQKWTPYIKAFESYCVTDRQTDRRTDTIEIIYDAAWRVVSYYLCVVDMTERNVIQQLVRVFEVKRLTTSKLHDVRRQQLYTEHVPAAGCHTDHPHSDHQQRALTRRLVQDFNSEGGTRGVSLRADENQLTHVQHFQKYLRCTSILYFRYSSCK